MRIDVALVLGALVLANLTPIARAQSPECPPVFSEAAPAERTFRSRGVVTEFVLPAVISASPSQVVTGPDGALWFTELNRPCLGRITPDGILQEFALPGGRGAGGHSQGITTGPDGAVWFTMPRQNRIDRITTDGQITTYPLLSQGDSESIVGGPDGALWFTQYGANQIGRISLDGAITEFVIPTPQSKPYMITRGPDDALWFTESGVGQIGRITTSGQIREFPLPEADSTPIGIATGPDGALWFAETHVHRIGRMTTTGELTEYPLLPGLLAPYGISSGPDGALWFTAVADRLVAPPGVVAPFIPEDRTRPGQIGRISTGGRVTALLWNGESAPLTVTSGADGAVWFTEPGTNHLGRLEVLQASDRQSLLSQRMDTQELFRATWGDPADQQWVREHHRELEQLRPNVR